MPAGVLLSVVAEYVARDLLRYNLGTSHSTEYTTHNKKAPLKGNLFTDDSPGEKVCLGMFLDISHGFRGKVGRTPRNGKKKLASPPYQPPNGPSSGA